MLIYCLHAKHGVIASLESVIVSARAAYFWLMGRTLQAKQTWAMRCLLKVQAMELESNQRT